MARVMRRATLSKLTLRKSTLRKATTSVITLFLLLFIAPIVSAQSQADGVVDLSPKGWIRHNDTLSFNIDRYDTKGGELRLELFSLPPTNLSAAQLLDKLLPVIFKKDYDAGSKVFPLPEDASASVNNNPDQQLDIASSGVMINRGKKDNVFLSVRAVVRKGLPVQFSLLTHGKNQGVSWLRKHGCAVN